jgi:O-methyltransferase involved in polyketide biosynthesis
MLDYPMLGISVLDETWLRKIADRQSHNLLFLAEGLFVYLPREGVQSIFKKMSETFTKSQIAFEVIHEKYTRGIWKKIVTNKMKRSLDISAGSAYDFGLRTASELEDFGENLKVLEEWSYFEDDDIRPKILKLFRNLKAFTRTQWTIHASIG